MPYLAGELYEGLFDGPDAGAADPKKADKARLDVTPVGPGLHLPGLGLETGVVPVGTTDHSHDSMREKEASDEQRKQERSLDPARDTQPDPIGDAVRRRLNGPPPKTKEQIKNEAKIDDALHAGSQKGKATKTDGGE
jgi:hypothetical protein